jgi:hypothetical protein
MKITVLQIQCDGHLLHLSAYQRFQRAQARQDQQFLQSIASRTLRKGRNPLQDRPHRTGFVFHPVQQRQQVVFDLWTFQ